MFPASPTSVFRTAPLVSAIHKPVAVQRTLTGCRQLVWRQIVRRRGGGGVSASAAAAGCRFGAVRSWTASRQHARCLRPRSRRSPTDRSRPDAPTAAMPTVDFKKVKAAHTRLQSEGFRSWSRFLAVSLPVMWVINPAVGCHYFPPGLQLPPQPLRGLLPVLLLGEQKQMDVNSLPKTVTRQRRDCDLNPGLLRLSPAR